MLASDPVTLARQWLNDTATGSGQRWSDATLIVFLNQAQWKLMRDVLFPSARMSIPTVPNQQEYQTGTILQTDSVYVNGQLAVPSDIPTLEGHQIGLYDQGLRGGNPAPVPGSAAPPSTSGPYAPTWSSVTPQGYPVANWSGWPAPDSVPACTGQRPRYYFRGGFIGLVPAPANSPPLDTNGNPIPNLVIDGVFLPPAIGSLADPMVFPNHFTEALGWSLSCCRRSSLTIRRRRASLGIMRRHRIGKRCVIFACGFTFLQGGRCS